MSSTFPVAFLEPSLNKFNLHSVMGSGFAQRSLEAQEVVARLEQCVPNLEAQLQEVDRFVGEGKDHAGKQLAFLAGGQFNRHYELRARNWTLTHSGLNSVLGHYKLRCVS